MKIKVKEYNEVVHLDKVAYEYWYDKTFTVYFRFSAMNVDECLEVKWKFDTEERYLEVKESIEELQGTWEV